MTNANAATFFRLPLSVLLVLFIYWRSPYAPWLAALTVVLAAAADAADGYLARKEGKVSKLGIYMDAAIDKIFVLAGLIALTDRGLLPVWMVLVIMFRDTLMGGLRSFAAAERVIIPANQWGKFKTTISWLALIAVILQIPYNYWVMMLFVVMAVISGFIYFYQSRDIWLRSLAGVPVQQIVEEAK